MNDSRNLAVELVLGLRSQLARVELASSRLARESLIPSAHELAQSISEAVGEVDREIDRITALLLPLESNSGPRDDLRSVLTRLGERIAPVLAASGTRWETPEVAAEPLCGDPLRLERVALALLRVGARIAGSGGRLRLDLVGDASRYGLALECRPAGDGAPGGDPQDVFSDVLPMLAAQGGALESQAESDAARATVWFSGESPWPGS